ncbi:MULTISPECIES: FxsA family protein [Sporosarcina]|uniref:FxsA family protein n=1 Tax=Sporosarcina contaminans TaxID=633403 RepID=A0ABW3U1H3_9BACL
MKWLIFAFVVVPLVELAVLLYVGSKIGVLWTILLILFTGAGGAYFAKRQGLKAWNDFRKRIASMETPGNAAIDSLCIFIGGVLLIFPGFLTDIVGLLLLLKWPRKLIRPFIVRRIYKMMKNGQIIIR